jgi:ribonuclease HII
VGASVRPTLRVEKRLLREGRTAILCIDEVGRGALGGPVTAGAVVVDATVRRPLAGVRDSKLLTPGAREELVPRIHRWAVAHAVGHATAAEIDEHGLTAALRLAGHRALALLAVRADLVLLDGSHDWLTPPEQPSLFAPPTVTPSVPDVVTMVKADLQCAAVAAASVLAKVERDGLMVELAADHPGYGWEENKGYASPAHLDALRRLGPCAEHRRSWNLPGNAVPEAEE